MVERGSPRTIDAEETIDAADFASKNLDHLGIVAVVCREIGLADEIDRIVGVDPRQKVTCGEAVVAIVLNALGFVDRPLYLFPEFMATKPVEMLIREGLKAEDFNDDVLGRTLDKLYRAGPEAVFMQITANAYGEYSGRFFHNDTTSMSLQGEYEHEEGDLDAVREKEKRWKYHKISSIEVEERRKKKGGERGRPRKDEPTQMVYHVKIALLEDKSAMEKETLKKGEFIVTTNELDSEKLGDEEALKAYKEQQYAERGFRFLKDPLFFASSMFLERESRIVAMVMIMGLALMVYGIAEKKLREALEKEGFE